MKYVWIAITAFFLMFFMGCSTVDSGLIQSLSRAIQGEELTEETIIAGLKEALVVGSSQAVDKLSKPGGYGKNPQLRIPMPEKLDNVATTLRRIGMGSQVEIFEGKMNEAAEHAAKQATPVFVDAIKQMTFTDARNILKGDKTAATDYFRDKTTEQLKELYAPIVKRHMGEVGAVEKYNYLMDKYNEIPLVPKLEFTIEDYATEEALKGLFKVLADVEQDIRTKPAARTTELLKKVFAYQDKN